MWALGLYFATNSVYDLYGQSLEGKTEVKKCFVNGGLRIAYLLFVDDVVLLAFSDPDREISEQDVK